MENFDEQLESVRSGLGVDGSPMEVIPSLLRGAFRAPDGYQFVASDYSQIELNKLAWLTNCEPMLATIRSGRKLYTEFASKFFQVPYDEVTPDQYQFGKPAVLQCGYGAGGGEWKTEIRTCPSCKGKKCLDCEMKGKTYDQVKSGLWGSAESYGVTMSQQEAHDAVAVYRESYPEIPNFWYRVEEPIRGLLDNPRHGITYFDKLVFQLVPDKLLRIVLPSGRCLHYLKPQLEDGQITYDTEDPKTHQRSRRRLYGSLLTENLVQAMARDVMAVGMVRAADAGFTIAGHTHDELLCLEPTGSHRDLPLLKRLMCDPIEWCPGLPLNAAGWTGPVYRKD